MAMVVVMSKERAAGVAKAFTVIKTGPSIALAEIGSRRS
jgi:hypothetical protein